MFRPQKQSTQALTIPAPIRGVDATQNMSMMDSANCVYAFNIMPKNFGMTVRQGYKEWANGFTGADGPRTLMAFHGQAEDETEDRLFVATSNGIWDISNEGETAPVQDVTWPVQGADAGRCIYVQYTTIAGAFLLVADGDNGYYTYEGGTGIWTEIIDGGGGITGPSDPRDLVFVSVWKNRVWFVEKNSTQAWYLGVGDVLGTATVFNFGSKFRYGGHLIGIWNWTLDGGDGVDDYLVAISEAGDVIVYRGTDPEQIDTFDLVGSWYVGAMPAGRRVASDFGGDLLVLSTYGVTSMANLLRGNNTEDLNSYVTARVAPFVREVMERSRDLLGWEISSHPREGIIIIDTPTLVGEPPLQFIMNIGTQAWAFWRDVPLSTLIPWHGNLYFGGPDVDRIWVFSGAVDQVFLDPEEDGAAETINWSLLTGFSDLDAPMAQKLVQLIRPVFNSEALPSFNVRARFDFNVSAISQAPIFDGSTFAGVWNVGRWDQAVWGGGDAGADNPLGGAGMGRYVAIAIRGSSASFTSLLAIDVAYTAGGIM